MQRMSAQYPLRILLAEDNLINQVSLHGCQHVLQATDGVPVLTLRMFLLFLVSCLSFRK